MTAKCLHRYVVKSGIFSQPDYQRHLMSATETGAPTLGCALLDGNESLMSWLQKVIAQASLHLDQKCDFFKDVQKVDIIHV